MTRIAGLLMAIVMMFTFSACTETETEPEPSTPQVTTSNGVTDEQFADMVRDNTDAFDGASDVQITDAAKSVCDLWDAGADLRVVTDTLLESGVDPYDGGFLAGAGTEMYCPEYSKNFD